MLGLQFQSVAFTVSEEGVIAVGGEQRRLATGGSGLTLRTMNRPGSESGLLSKGVYVVSGTSASPAIQQG